jgi:hypothetical protein
MKSRVLIAQVRQRNAGRAKKPGSEVHSGARARGQEGDQDKDDVYEDGQSHAEHYPEKAPARRAAPTSPTEHDDEEVHDPQTRRHLDVLSYPDLRRAERLALPGTKRGMQSQNEQPDHGCAREQEGQRHETTAGYDDAASPGITPPPAKHRFSSPNSRGRGRKRSSPRLP